MLHRADVAKLEMLCTSTPEQPSAMPWTPSFLPNVHDLAKAGRCNDIDKRLRRQTRYTYCGVRFR